MNDNQISLLTAGRDKPYALGLATALAAAGMKVDFIGGDELDSPELRGNPQINFLNLRGDQSVDAGLLEKMSRVLIYYFRLVFYAATARPKVFHILWNNKFELFDRTVLMLYYKCLGKKTILTAHNVNICQRDGNDSFLNRLSLKIQYRLCDHIFVHTEKMKGELISAFGVSEKRASVIPLGINNTVPNTALNGMEARQRLGLGEADKVILFFGCIAPYKGLEYLIAAFVAIAKRNSAYRLVIAGKPKGRADYWTEIQELIAGSGAGDRIIQKIEFVPDEETEVFFKAADVLVLPYTHIFQSGVLFLGYSFGLPVIAADVGSLKEEIFDGKTGFVFKLKNAAALARTIGNYFESDLHLELDSRRAEIQSFANERYSWRKVAAITTAVYSKLSPVEKNYCVQAVPEKS
jgi:glycosyltransferase involved in cell wall biosynthesis